MCSENKKLTCDEFIQKFKGKSLSEILEAMNIDFTKCKGVIPESTADLIVRKNSFFEKNYAVANNNYNSQYSRVCKGNYCGYDFFLFDYCDIFSKSTILEIMIKNYNLEYIDIYSDSYKIKEKISCIAIYTAFIGYIIFCVSLILKYGIEQIIYVSNFPVWFIASVGLLFYAYKYYKQYRATQKNRMYNSFKSSHSFNIKADNVDYSKKFITASFMKLFYDLKKVYNAGDIFASFHQNIFCVQIKTSKGLFPYHDPNKPIFDEDTLKAVYNKINAIYLIINYFSKNDL